LSQLSWWLLRDGTAMVVTPGGGGLLDEMGPTSVTPDTAAVVAAVAMLLPLLVDGLLPSSSLCLSVVADVIGGRTSSYFFQHIIITTSLGFTQHRLIFPPFVSLYVSLFLYSLYLLYIYQSLFALGSSHNNTDDSRDMSSLFLRFFPQSSLGFNHSSAVSLFFATFLRITTRVGPLLCCCLS